MFKQLQMSLLMFVSNKCRRHIDLLLNLKSYARIMVIIVYIEKYVSKEP